MQDFGFLCDFFLPRFSVAGLPAPLLCTLWLSNYLYNRCGVHDDVDSQPKQSSVFFTVRITAPTILHFSQRDARIIEDSLQNLHFANSLMKNSSPGSLNSQCNTVGLTGFSGQIFASLRRLKCCITSIAGCKEVLNVFCNLFPAGYKRLQVSEHGYSFTTMNFPSFTLPNLVLLFESRPSLKPILWNLHYIVLIVQIMSLGFFRLQLPTLDLEQHWTLCLRSTLTENTRGTPSFIVIHTFVSIKRHIKFTSSSLQRRVDYVCSQLCLYS